MICLILLSVLDPRVDIFQVTLYILRTPHLNMIVYAILFKFTIYSYIITNLLRYNFLCFFSPLELIKVPELMCLNCAFLLELLIHINELDYACPVCASWVILTTLFLLMLILCFCRELLKRIILWDSNLAELTHYLPVIVFRNNKAVEVHILWSIITVMNVLNFKYLKRFIFVS